MVKLYSYAGCGTCRKAISWLSEREIAFELIPIRETPPSRAELRRMLKRYDGEIRRLFNTSGLDYRALGLKDKLPSMSDSEALDLLASNGNLVKRPFALFGDSGLVGFDPGAWDRELNRS